MVTVDQKLDEVEAFIGAGRVPRAESAARLVLREQPNNVRAMYLLAHTRSAYGDHREALRLHQQAVLLGTEIGHCYQALAEEYERQGLFDEAVRVYRQWVAADPNSASAQHMLATMLVGQAPARCSPEYIRALFNSFAPSFDLVLQGLAYRAPEAVAEAVERWRRDDGTALEVLDAGCGTGLCGAAVRQYCNNLVGVDLAPEMLSLARNRACYDELVLSDLDTFLETREDSFDVIVSSDVLIYFGDLHRTIAQSHRALKRSGLLIFTVEALRTEGNDPYRLTRSGRYAHRDSYIKDVLRACGFRTKSLRSEPIRYEHGSEAMGFVVVAKKQATARGFGSFGDLIRFPFRKHTDARRLL